MPSEQCIAVVDDDEGVRLAVSNLLESTGYRVLSFGSAREFLGSQDLGRLSCVICDVFMPGMSGLQLILISEGRVPGTPFIMITAYDSLCLDWKMSSRPNVHAVLRKPFDPEQLLAAVLAATG